MERRVGNSSAGRSRRCTATAPGCQVAVEIVAWSTAATMPPDRCSASAARANRGALAPIVGNSGGGPSHQAAASRDDRPATEIGLPGSSDASSDARTPRSRCRRGSSSSWTTPSCPRARSGRLRCTLESRAEGAACGAAPGGAAPAGPDTSAPITRVASSAAVSASSMAGAPPTRSTTSVVRDRPSPARSAAALPPSMSGRSRVTRTTSSTSSGATLSRTARPASTASVMASSSGPAWRPARADHTGR